MSIAKIVPYIKQIHPKAVLLFKSGAFYHVYGKDSYIIAYLFDYKMKIINDNIPTCGFPIDSKNKIIVGLEEHKIDYIFLDPRNNYDVDEKSQNKKLNKYDEIYEKASSQMKNRKKYYKIIYELKEIMDDNDFFEKAKRIEKIIHENREV